MRSLRSGLVDIVRDFLAVHASVADLIERHARGELRFDEVARWVGEDERSDLFRLKERCHSIFRPIAAEDAPEMRQGALLDLAVGSLFHEAMKLRENLYQQERYGPRVTALQRQGDSESVELFEEFEKILTSSAKSLDESVAEVGRLTGQTRQQLVRLIVDQGRTGRVARCLLEVSDELRSVYADGIDDLYERVFGSAVEGYLQAADSYLESAYYADALAALEEAGRRAPGHRVVRREALYAEGMQAFFSRDYPRSVDRLSAWLDVERDAPAADRLRMALASSRYVERLPVADSSPEVIARAKDLSERLRMRKPD